MAKQSTSYLKLLISGVVLLLILAGVIAAISISKSGKVKKENAERVEALKEGPVVKTDLAKLSGDAKQITLLGEARPYESATVYAKISGYMDKILVDKGDKVSAGQLLAVITNPEITQQYNSAKADLDNKKKILERDKALFAKKFISEEEVDLSETAVRLAEATYSSVSQQQDYQQLKAPFSGTVTARYADPGALIQNAINSQASAQSVVTIADLSRLRIYVYVEQRDAGFLKLGYPVDISLTERPDMHVKASITRLTGELDLHTRMMTVEIDLDNRDNKIIPGSYVQVHITGPQTKAPQIQVPATALVFHKSKALIAVIDKDTVLHFKPIKVGENTGDKVTILEGLNEGDRVALSVGESVLDGQKVRLEQ